MDPGSALQHFLQPFHVDAQKIHTLSSLFLTNFRHLARNADDQFLATPISESILRPLSQRGHGRHLAIDIVSGGTNLRVGFVELHGKDTANAHNALPSSKPNGTASPSSLPPPSLRLEERAWPIDDRLKADTGGDPQLLFDWIGARIASVLRAAREESRLPSGDNDNYVDDEEALPLGITFSFPMVQHTISDATIMTMGKGFSINGNAELGPLLIKGYSKARAADNGAHRLPPIRIAAISNDSVSTLISFIYLFDESQSQSQSPRHATKKASMGLIVGTGCNATITLPLTALGPSKWPADVSTLPGESARHARIAVNTEWSIRGTAPPLRELGLITPWDTALDDALVGPGEIAGFQPLEYMTAGRYLGELGRLVLVDYLQTVLGHNESSLPTALLTRYALTTTFLSHFKPAANDLADPTPLQTKLEKEFPVAEAEKGVSSSSFQWTPTIAAALYHIAKAIEIRAAGIVAAATVALLKLAQDIPPSIDQNHVENYNHNRKEAETQAAPITELGVGYTGGCIAHFQDYLADTQDFLDKIIKLDYDEGHSEGSQEGSPPLRIVLSPCHDGGIKGAGILAAATGVSQTQQT
ncbi:hexokinase-1 [Colletotrichum orchidophilum]|uniref:Phosphotransferase n=1 Tax=Colletotrichum orchidophilum TaxID=1209926 RepID=A0A1G4AQT3_9PEZI|nr:hexokinase-1 [Colletotrichum orchidophilum]OHE91461.1 hexokinase-1 [Colletotrichum orchidophilum]